MIIIDKYIKKKLKSKLVGLTISTGIIFLCIDNQEILEKAEIKLKKCIISFCEEYKLK